MKRLALGALLLLALLLPAAVYAQGASITGIVKDPSGAVLPGVTVEASSPVLIEKVRSTVSSGDGQYRIVNLLPGQFVQPFIDAAFSDLGLDRNTLPPSQLTDPQTGQPATPPLPVPYPRTGQGGEPRQTLPDAITGNPGDQGCGPPGLPLPGPTG